jgi:hypothetical protein
MSRLRLALRLALREGRADAWRVLLSAALIALAVALGILAFASTVPAGDAPDLRVDVQAANGFSGGGDTARPFVRNGRDDRVVVTGVGRRLALTLSPHRVGFSELHQRTDGAGASVPPGSRVESFRTLGLRLVGRERVAAVTVADPDPSGPFDAAGNLSSGRRPRAAAEILLTDALARRLHVGIGDHVTAIAASGRRSFSVVGLGSVSQRLTSGGGATVDALVRPGGLTGAAGGGRTWLIRLAHSPFAAGTSGGSGGPGASLSYEGAGRYELLSIGLLSLFQVLALALPLYLTVAVLAIGLERRAWRSRLLMLAGADGRLVTSIAVMRGILVGVAAAGAGLVLALAVARWALSGVTLNAVAVWLPAALAVAGAVVASLAAARMAATLLDAGRRAGRPPTGGEAVRLMRRAGVAVAGLAALLALLATDIPGRGAIAVVFVVALLATLPALAGALIVLPGLLPLPGRLRAAARSLARARWVTAPAAASFAMAALLVIFVLAGTVAIPSTSAPRASALGDARSAALTPLLRSTPSGVLTSPRAAAVAATARLHPSLLVPVYPMRSGMAAISVIAPPLDLPFADSLTYVASKNALERLAGRTALPPSAVVVLGRAGVTARTVDIASRRLPVVHARPDWPPALPHVFITRASAALFGASAGSAPTWIVRGASTVSGARANALRASATDEGLHAVVAADAAGPQDGFGSGAGRSVALVVTVLGLVFGGVATMLVLAECREETRGFQLAGALPRDQRLAAAATALFFSGAGTALVLLLYAAVAALAWANGSSDLAGLLAYALPPLIALPFVLAAASALLVRPSRSVGRIGRVPRAVSSARS